MVNIPLILSSLRHILKACHSPFLLGRSSLQGILSLFTAVKLPGILLRQQSVPLTGDAWRAFTLALCLPVTEGGSIKTCPAITQWHLCLAEVFFPSSHFYVGPDHLQ